MQTPLLVLYCVVLLVLCTYGVHRAKLVLECIRFKKRLALAETRVEIAESELPTVTVQLPLYNEATVARRLIEATGRMDYPLEKLEIQVLDDSTDETAGITRAAVDELC